MGGEEGGGGPGVMVGVRTGQVVRSFGVLDAANQLTYPSLLPMGIVQVIAPAPSHTHAPSLVPAPALSHTPAPSLLPAPASSLVPAPATAGANLSWKLTILKILICPQTDLISSLGCFK